jgi:hypothetical protein
VAELSEVSAHRCADTSDKTSAPLTTSAPSDKSSAAPTGPPPLVCPAPSITRRTSDRSRHLCPRRRRTWQRRDRPRLSSKAPAQDTCSPSCQRCVGLEADIPLRSQGELSTGTATCLREMTGCAGRGEDACPRWDSNPQTDTHFKWAASTNWATGARTRPCNTNLRQHQPAATPTCGNTAGRGPGRPAARGSGLDLPEAP